MSSGKSSTSTSTSFRGPATGHSLNDQYCVCQSWTTANLSERFPRYKVLDRESAEYQMEAFIYTLAILLFYTMTTGAFMMKFILQNRDPWDNGDHDGPNPAGSTLPLLIELRERERHRKLLERQARRDVKLRMINHLNVIRGLGGDNNAQLAVDADFAEKLPGRRSMDGGAAETADASDLSGPSSSTTSGVTDEQRRFGSEGQLNVLTSVAGQRDSAVGLVGILRRQSDKRRHHRPAGQRLTFGDSCVEL